MKWKWFAFGHITIALLYFTWLTPPFSSFWNALDHHSYLFFSSLLGKSKASHTFWALCNSKWIDWVHDVVMFSLFGLYISQGNKKKRLTELIVAVCIITFTITAINRHAFTGVRRMSPTKTFKYSAPRLSKSVSFVNVKDKSKTSFPGDHATTALLFASVVTILMNRRFTLFAYGYAIFFILPRLVVGAHWLSDIAVGSLSITLFSLSWFYATPLASFIPAMVERGNEKKLRSPSKSL